MRNRAATEHRDAVSRRLALLREEIARADQGPGRSGVEVEERDSAEPAAARPGHRADEEWSGEHTRVAAPVAEAPPALVDLGSPAGPRVPVPGRHAARRVRSAGSLVPEPLQGRVALGPWHLVVVTTVVATGLLLTCWWLLRSDPAPAAAPAPLVSASALATPVAGASGASGVPPQAAPSASTGATGRPGIAGAEEGAGMVTVDVEGRVRRPGIAVLPQGSRVVDAIEAAGGATARKHLAGLNLAAVLADGQQIVVGGSAGGLAAPVAPAPGGAPGAVPGSPGALVNLNTATGPELETLPGVGPVTAQAILDWRSQHGGFTSVDELLEVDGIGEKTLASLAPLVSV